jgi:hypothetical protein
LQTKPTADDIASSANSTITLGTATTAQTATIQLKTKEGVAINERRMVRAYMCTDADGDTVSSAGANTSAAPTTGAIIATHTAKLCWDILTNASGQAVITFDNTSGGGTYADRVVLVCDDGIVVSDALAVANA